MLKKTGILLLSFLLFVSAAGISPPAKAEGIGVSAKSAVLICADTGRVLFEKNANEKLPMASTTKIMTALLALEAAQAENTEITITDEMVRVEGSSMGLLPGYVIKLDDVVKGMMMCSGNDAATTAAYAVAGSPEKFSKLMNEKASQIGMKNSHFVTPSGLDAEDHYSTAYDMALLGAYAMENQSFYDIVSQKSQTVNLIKPAQKQTFQNHNRLLSLYDKCVGIKTGFTKKSGRCLVSCAEKDGVRLIAVTLNAPDDWNDHINLYNYGFDRMTSVSFSGGQQEYSLPVVGGVKGNVPVRGNKDAKVTVPKEDAENIETRVELPAFEYAPIRQGQPVGKVRYLVEGKEVASIDLIASRDVEVLYVEKSFWKKLSDFFKNLFRW